MAKGKQSLLEITAPENIIHTDEEIGSIPFFMIDDEYGIAVDQYCYKLVGRKQASRTGKIENNEEEGKVYSYYRWDDLKYLSTIEEVIESYVSVKEKFLNKKLLKSTELKELINIRLQIKEDIHKALNVDVVDNQVRKVSNLLDTIKHLHEKAEELKNGIEELVELKNETIEEIKEARKIIVDRDKPKKRRLKLEE